ncbi:MAG: cupin domain-containing protein [Acidimicrobiia bacterium]|nr:cupin domain-containing protein [Acidimicrobiia bacterium]
MTTQPTLASEPFVLGPQEGTHLHFLDNRATVKVAAGPRGSMSVVEFQAPKGFGPPRHIHDNEDELFIVLSGELLFYSGDEQIPGPEGTYAFLPRALPHTFQVLTETATFVNVTSSTTHIPEFDQMVMDLGITVPEPTMPDPMQIDPARVAEVCADHGIQIVGPPPAPLS